MHAPVRLDRISVSFSHKTLFHDLSLTLHYGQRIGIIGDNGAGKSILLKIIAGLREPAEGRVIVPDNLERGYLSQLLPPTNKSGAQTLNQELSGILANDPNMLLLDEPTNHLDHDNRASLMRLLGNFRHTLIIISHDTHVLKNLVDQIWHVEDGHVHIFDGSWSEYQKMHAQRQRALFLQLDTLRKQKEQLHKNLMQEEERAKQSRLKGEKNIRQKKWPTIVSKAKAGRAQETSGSKKSALSEKKHAVLENIRELYIKEPLSPKFHFTHPPRSYGVIVSVQDGSVSYVKPVLKNINLTITGQDHIAICGPNGCGKSTLFKAILGDVSVIRHGIWQQPRPHEIGYLDQHYLTLNPQQNALEHLMATRPDWSMLELRTHLNDFLIRKNEEVMLKSEALSGGEKARLCLALIAARPPKLLLLDEITNNLDLTTKNHVLQVLKSYEGAYLLISHDDDFIRELEITTITL